MNHLVPVASLFEAIIGKRPSPETLWRWRTRGVRVPSGESIKLKCQRCGTRWYATAEDVEAFIKAQTQAFEAESQRPTLPNLADRLKAAGIAS